MRFACKPRLRGPWVYHSFTPCAQALFVAVGRLEGAPPPLPPPSAAEAAAAAAGAGRDQPALNPDERRPFLLVEKEEVSHNTRRFR